MSDSVKSTSGVAGIVKVRVHSVCKIQQFQGEAVLAGLMPRFVVTLLLEGSRRQHTVEKSDVSFTVHTVAFFAIDSVVRLFRESEVVGNVYDLLVETEVFNGQRSYFLSVV